MRALTFYTISLLFPLAATQPYDVRFLGIEDRAAAKAIKDSSELLLLRERPPASLNGLRYRIKQDIPNLLKTLHSFSYYDAQITYEIEEKEQKAIVSLTIHPGPRYTLSSFQVFHGDCKQELKIPCCDPICPEQLGLKIGDPADSAEIVRAEQLLLGELSRCGHPLAYIDKRRVLVDVSEKKVDASVCVQEGPLARFGHVNLFGLKTVKPRFIERKISWEEGEVFNSDFITETEKRLIKSDLFNSVLISYSESVNDKNEVTMNIRLSETKHRSFSIGVFYATVDGPGGTLSWSHKNLRGMGEQLRLTTNVSARFVDGTINYRKPDLWRSDLTLSILGAVSRENIHPYLAFTYLESNRIELAVDSKRDFSIGLKGEYISVNKSANDGTYLLMGLPFFGRYRESDAPLDPRKGYFFSYSGTAYQSLQKSSVRFFKQQIQGAIYIPFDEDKKFSLAMEATIGSVAGAAQEDVPLPKLFLGGSQDDLRGYTYKTVSPLNHHRKPLGGRSAIFTSIELRVRITKTIGIVPFADFGTVALSEIPQVNEKWYKSVGGGLRYYTFFGPLRFDVGFPLNRRKNIDTWGKVYASIGQSF